ncbi:ABC transporter permease [Fulvivirga ligni]|uniref:ABC transporter permease n=1 Tax=Fulvivirga ligni TaxID=2904246 RepID=UPI001F1F79A5|nr:ABC transporter permease [Fulvivirga ligni]UII24197.1 ABC transporter permease [Fulvivirga ligni]
MIKNYLTSALRYFLRHKFFTVINILGLAVGFASALLLSIFVWQETSYDKFHENKERIARVVMEYSFSGEKSKHAVNGSIVGPTFSREFPEVKAAVRFDVYPRTVKYKDKLYEETKFLHADSTFFEAFSFDLISGNEKTALASPNKVVLTPESANKYFGTTDVLGETIKVGTKDYEITGVIKPAPATSQIKYDFIGSFSSLWAYQNEQWSSANYPTYLLLNQAGDFATLQQKIDDYMLSKRQEMRMDAENHLGFILEPLIDVHLKSEVSGLEPNVNITYIYLFSVVAFLILLVACVNYVNLATARSVERGTEVGVRKVLGASKGQLFVQYINESVLSVFSAAVLGIALTTAVLPFFNQTLNKTYSIGLIMEPQVIAVILAVLVVVAILAGVYPAFVLSRFAPAKTLKGAVKSSKGGVVLRRSLIVFQFIVSAMLIISSLGIYKQLNYIKTTDLGYQRDHVIALSISGKDSRKFQTLKSQLIQFPQIESMTMAYETPTEIGWGDGIETSDGNSLMITANPVEYNYLKTLNIKLLAGRDFDERDQKQAFAPNSDSLQALHMNVIFNEEAVKQLGWTAEEAVGQVINYKSENTEIIGVMDDFHFAALHEKVGPLALFVDDIYGQVMIRINGDDVSGALANIGNVWSQVYPDLPYSPIFLNDEYNGLYETEQQLGKLFVFFTSLAIFLGCIGLLGLSALMISHRIKEIGIRKVLGASLSSIVTLLSADFAKLILVAVVIAAPLSWYIMSRWLQGFAYHIDMPWEVFIISGVVLVAVSLLTISTQTIGAAMRNPSDVIRND